MKAVRFVTILSLVLAVAATVTARQASSVASFLREERGARLAAYGGAGAALSGDLFAAQLNPASLAGIDRYQAAFEHDNLILDITGNHAALAGNYDGIFSWGVYYTGVNYGSTLRTTVSDPFGASNATFNGEDMAVGLMTGIEFGSARQLRIGMTGKYYKLRIDQFSAFGAAIDFGGQWSIQRANGTATGFSLGAAVQNIGTAVNFRGSNEPMPTTYRFGGAYVEEALGVDMEAAVDLVGGVEEEFHLLAGLGVLPTKWLALRLGFNSRRDFASGLSAGFGVLWRDLAFDYAYIPFGDFGSRNRFSLGYAWGASQTEPRPMPPRAELPQPAAVSRPLISTRPTIPQREIIVEPAPPLPPPRPAPASTTLASLPPVEVDVVRETASEGPSVLRPAGEIETPETTPTTIRERTSTAAELMEEGDRAVEQERHFDAVRAYQRAVALEPENELAHYNLATVQFLRKNYAAAEASYRVVLRIAPADVESLIYVGLCRYWQDDHDGARRIWLDVLERDPRNAAAREYLKALSY